MQIICQLKSGSEAVEGACCRLDWLLAIVCTYVDTIDIPDSFAIRVIASRRRLIARDSDEVPELELSSAILEYPGGVIMSEF